MYIFEQAYLFAPNTCNGSERVFLMLLAPVLVSSRGPKSRLHPHSSRRNKRRTSIWVSYVASIRESNHVPTRCSTSTTYIYLFLHKLAVHVYCCRRRRGEERLRRHGHTSDILTLIAKIRFYCGRRRCTVVLCLSPMEEMPD